MMRVFDERYYLFGSRILTHTAFWVGYYLFFSLLWANDGNYYRSFGLELILMPLRILASYAVMYYLIPRLLLVGKEIWFVMAYLGVIVVAGLFQRVLVHYYYELLLLPSSASLFDPAMILRAIVLVNSTVLLLSALKIFQYWKLERASRESDELIEIRAEKRNHRVRLNSVIYVEGLGNYVTWYLSGDRKLISYSSMKEVEKMLPEQFVRIHKSYIVNRDRIQSYTSENVEVEGRMLPVGKKMELKF
jgi:hypothetical protein